MSRDRSQISVIYYISHFILKFFCISLPCSPLSLSFVVHAPVRALFEARPGRVSTRLIQTTRWLTDRQLGLASVRCLHLDHHNHNLGLKHLHSNSTVQDKIHLS